MDYIEIEQQVKNSIALINILLDDMEFARNLVDKEIQDLKQNPFPQDERSVELILQPVMRIMTHCVFAAIDGFCSRTKNIALQLCDFRNIQVSKEEREDILETKTNKKGISRSHYHKTEDNIILTFNILYRAFGFEYEMIDREKLDKIRGAIAIRNKITHPKSPADMEITAVDYNDMSVAFEWFGQNMKGILTLLKNIHQQ